MIGKNISFKINLISDDEFEMHFQDTKQLEKNFQDLEIEDLNKIE